MASLASAALSTIGRKILMSLTGLVMFGFVIGHMVGNLQLLTGDGDIFNRYGHLLVSLGGLLIVVELVLLGSLLVHVWTAINIARGRQTARPVAYGKLRSRGAPSRLTFASSTMIYTGVLILIFLVIHIKSFKYGPAEAEGYVTTVDGVEMRDLHRLVIEKFQQPEWAIGYAIAMVILGIHLSHAFWSAFQSLGLYHHRYTPVLYSVGRLLAFVIAFGFFVIPIWIYYSGAA